MKFNLLTHEKVNFDIEGCDLLPKLSALVPTCLIRGKRDQGTCEHLQRYLNSALAEMNGMNARSMVCDQSPPTKKLKNEDQIQAKGWDLLLTIAQIPKDPTIHEDFDCLEHHEIDFTVLIEGDLISCLRDVCGEDVLLNFEVRKVPVYARRVEKTELSTGDMKIVPFSSKTYGCKAVVDFDFELYNRHWYNGFNIQGYVTITLIVSDNIAIPPINDNLKINKKLLNEKVLCDTVIVANNGVKSECHKSFLSAHSTVFHAMLSGNFKESESRTIVMSDMTERGVKALLAYLYYWETHDAINDSAIAFELFRASHKYDIDTLEDTMKKLFMTKPNDWFELNVALDIYIFVRNLSNGSDLMQRVISLLKKNAGALQASEHYKDLLEKDPTALEELLRTE